MRPLPDGFFIVERELFLLVAAAVEAGVLFGDTGGVDTCEMGFAEP
jgi:hypothetical protein